MSVYDHGIASGRVYNHGVSEVGSSECVAIVIIVAVREVIAAVADPYLDFPVLPGCSCARFLRMHSAPM